MSQIVFKNSPDTFIIISEVNDYGAVTFRGDNGSMYHITSYENSGFRGYLVNHHAGNHVRMNIVRAGVRANIWRVSVLYPGADK